MLNSAPIHDFCDPQDESKLIMTRLRYRGANFVINKEGADYEGKAPVTSSTPSQFVFYVYFDDVDSIYQQAIAAGMTSIMKPENTYWGDRRARLTCPFGHVWDIAQRIQ